MIQQSLFWVYSQGKCKQDLKYLHLMLIAALFIIVQNKETTEVSIDG